MCDYKSRVGRSLNITAVVWCLLLGGQFQTPSLSEKQAVNSAQRIPASELDAELPPRPFADWFRQIVGPQAGVNWQLNECGEQPGLLAAQGRDLPACAEVNALLPDGRKVVVMIEVGTFKNGITGQPGFYHAAIELESELYRVRRLRDLPEGLRGPAALRDRYSIKLMAPNSDLHWLLPVGNADKALSGKSADEAVPPPPVPRPTVAPTASLAPPPPEPRKVSEGVARGNAIVKVQPLYPASAKKMQAAGSVQVQVIISEEGRVIEATTVSGHPLLSSAAVDAARKWVFKPTMLNGIPVQVQSTLTFVFTLTQ